MAVVGVRASGGSQTCAVEGAYAPRTSRQERLPLRKSRSKSLKTKGAAVLRHDVIIYIRCYLQISAIYCDYIA